MFMVIPSYHPPVTNPERLRRASKNLNHLNPERVILLQIHQDLGQRPAFRPVGELADDIGPDLGWGFEDCKQFGPSTWWKGLQPSACLATEHCS